LKNYIPHMVGMSIDKMPLFVGKRKNMNFYKEIAARLKDVRTNHKLSRKKLSLLIDTKERTIESYELGERKPTLEYIEKIADHFKIHPAFLLGSSDNTYIDPHLIKFLKIYMQQKVCDLNCLSNKLDISNKRLEQIINNNQMTIHEILDITERLDIKPSELGIEIYDEKRSVLHRYYRLEESGQTLKQMGISIPINEYIQQSYNTIDELEFKEPREIHVQEICDMLEVIPYEWLVRFKKQIRETST